MAFLTLFRHGKSDWDADYSTDHERPLSKRGRRAARRMGRLIAEVDRVPDRAVTSSALRARSTLELAIESGKWKCEVEVTDSLYGASPASLMDLIRAQSKETASLLICGHEPAWSDLASQLIGGGRIRLPTAAMAGIDFGQLQWSQVGPGEGQLRWLLIPRLFS